MVWGTTWDCPLEPPAPELPSKLLRISPALWAHLTGPGAQQSLSSCLCPTPAPGSPPEPGEASSPAWSLGNAPLPHGKWDPRAAALSQASQAGFIPSPCCHSIQDVPPLIRCSGLLRISYVHKKLMYKWVKKVQRQESSEMEEEESSFGNGRTSNPCSGNSQLDTQGPSGTMTQD